PHAVFTNDKYPRSFNEDWQVIPTHVKKGASIGANATVLCGITVGSYAMVAAGAVVTSDVPNHGLVVGSPARLVGFVCFCGRPLAEKPLLLEEEVVYRCSSCGREVKVSRSDYERMLKERQISKPR
ncbi:MAG: N-acetyltransferase, partial [Thermoproteota archaeon]